MYLGKVNISLKKSVLDPQGTTVMKAFHDLGEKSVIDVRIGKYIEVKLNSSSLEEAKEELDRLCKNLLVNQVIETYQIFIERDEK
ncbi:MAG: phosphoribosylformylglycinamidine synthase subunit PurS [Spirochaetia bacterium]|nr:phosphoribosylformylglycinamidine synthase subunit PurS [Spirochaetia bacterium]